MPAMGKRDYDISTSVTGDSGENFLKLLTDEQRENITSIIERQRKAMAEIIETRRAVSVELRKFLAGGMADRAKVLALGRRYGELDGGVSWMYATAFAKVNRTLTAEQRAALLKLRNLEGCRSAPAYLYSQPMAEAPSLPDTEFLLGLK
jgi:Spy/CpxP family protein refolding chaperone